SGWWRGHSCPPHADCQARMPAPPRIPPHRAENFAADLLLAGLAPGQHAPAGAQDGDPQPVEPPPDLLVPLVHPAARLRVPLDVPDHLLTLGAVLQEDLEDDVRFADVRRLL